jgi:hypothetical protein
MSSQNVQLISLFDEYMITIINNDNIEIPDDYDDIEPNYNFNRIICNMYFHSATLYNWIDALQGFEGKYNLVREFFKEYIYEIDREYLLNLIDPIMLK